MRKAQIYIKRHLRTEKVALSCMGGECRFSIWGSLYPPPLGGSVKISLLWLILNTYLHLCGEDCYNCHYTFELLLTNLSHVVQLYLSHVVQLYL